MLVNHSIQQYKIQYMCIGSTLSKAHDTRKCKTKGMTSEDVMLDKHLELYQLGEWSQAQSLLLTYSQHLFCCTSLKIPVGVTVI